MILQDKIAVLTGASRGLGKAFAAALVQKGVRVYGIARNSEALREVQKELGALFQPVALDLTQHAAVAEWVKQTFTAAPCPDILINNAGIGSFEKIEATSEETWVQTMNINLNGMFHITAPIVALMKEKKTPSHIVNVGSILGKVGRVNGTAYCTSKFGVVGFSEALSLEVRPYHVKVTCINPGSIQTDFFHTSGIELHENMLHPEDLAGMLIYLLETPDNMLVNELTVRPLYPKHP